MSQLTWLLTTFCLLFCCVCSGNAANTNATASYVTFSSPTASVVEKESESKGNDREAGTCFGTNSGISLSTDRNFHYSSMLRRYKNCRIVKGNLEITGLENPALDVSFLKDIEEVTGYVVIALNYIPYIPLGNLKIIRGRKLFWNTYSLFVAFNYNYQDKKEALKELGLRSLSEIFRGNVYINYNQLCFADTILWNDIFTLDAAAGEQNANVTSLSTEYCGTCDSSCPAGCWGGGPDMCQKLTKTICSDDCGGARCRGAHPQDCCHPQCAVGCTGPTERDCMACLHVNHNGSCLESCPPPRVLDPQTQSLVPNPHVKYRYSDRCVDKCPRNLLIEDNTCVTSCGIGSRSDGSEKCVKCTSNNCGEECFGVGHQDGPLADDSFVNSLNVHHFEGCNVIKGNVIFDTITFKGDKYIQVPPMNVSQLQKSFENVKVIQGFLKIVSWPRELSDFSVFKHLHTIEGRDTYHSLVALLIQGNIYQKNDDLTQITSLGLSSLTSIKYGNVYIGYMRGLCYDRMVNWSVIIKRPIAFKIFKNGLLLRKNKPSEECVAAVCDPTCSNNGCWGPGQHQCLPFSQASNKSN